MPTLTYSRAPFDVADEDAARRIILTTEYEQDSAERWARETPYLAGLIGEQLPLGPDSLVIDYGCGIGRLAKALIERHGCHVLGVDVSERMRALAPDYVRSQNFSAISPHVLRSLGGAGLQATAAISVWVLQHCHRPDIDLGLIAAALRPQAPLFVVNEIGRAVPTEEGRWANDGLDIRQVLDARFALRQDGKLDTAVVPERTSRRTFWATYTRR